MRLRSLQWVLLVLSLAAPVTAAPIGYTFSGSGDTQLTGGFSLDDDAGWSTTIGSNGGVSSVLSSPLQHLWGTYGAYTFEGFASLYVIDMPELGIQGSDTIGSDYWIIRAALTGPTVDDLAPATLNLFVYTSPAALQGSSLLPPTHSASPYDFQFTLSFANVDGTEDSFTGGTLTTLTRVPEPSTLSWLGLCAAGLLSRRFR